LESQVSQDGREYFASRPRVQLSGDGLTRKFRRGIGVPTEKQWTQVILQPVVIRDLAAKPEGRVAFDPGRPDTPANQLLRELVPVVRRAVPDADRFERVELACEFDDLGVVVLGAAALETPAGQ
jgi:hypothetical protein